MEQIVVRGIAERLLFEAPDSDYRVFRLHDEDDDATYTVTGHGTKPLVGDRLEVKGHWVQHKRYGRQFLDSLPSHNCITLECDRIGRYIDMWRKSRRR